ncbi:HD domain-containing phosphohydrolase [Alkaliphilus peptidifermentans]|uniref:Diguanylate cyclase (GGDEF) domain-containing protein n=1 Tax=Alkaliphilus peptidifermentans DSM 18978 TaxID=1120976 RepID=A0A1G5HP78_9FIRM|nr:HD domain-containing phosphohydrolase [Alkaliphilus peptidifermentans]SCY65685.1 diguanylate cyclase (GGDEF) domain-containing protein [Alkaliphilus peptidifermentans DSM 18978]
MQKKINLLSKKITCRLLAFFIATSLIPLIVSVTYLSNSMEKQLLQYQNKEIEQLRAQITYNFYKYQQYMSLIAYDYSYWDDTYYAIINENWEWIDENIIEWLPEGMNFTYAGIINNEYELLRENIDGFYHKYMDLILPTHKLKMADFYKGEDSLYLTTVVDVLSNSENLPPNGKLIVAARVDEDFLINNIKLVDVDINLLYNNNLVINGQLEEILRVNNHTSYKQIDDNLHIFIPVINQWDEVLAYGIATISYSFYQRALNTLTHSLIIVYSICFLLLAMAILLIKHKLFDPISKVQEVINNIRLLKKPVVIPFEPKDEIGQLAHSFNDLAKEIDQHNQHLKKLSITDEITTLYNYRHFITRIDEKICIGNPFILAFIEIDFIKTYSNTFTRTKTDELLRKIGCLFKKVMPAENEAFVVGPSTFSIISNINSVDNIVDNIKQFQHELTLLQFWGKNRLPTDLIHASAGISKFPQEGNTKDSLIKLTDDKLYRASHFIHQRIGSFYSVFHNSNHVNDITDLNHLYSVTRTMMSILQAMDPYTLCHSEGVARYALIIGEGMNLSNKDLETLKYSALLHDIGKIELGSELLNKKDPLTEDDFKKIKMHTIYGVNILCSIEGFGALLPIIHSHHEWYNGNGYPDGLEGKKIPLLARIISVADAYDTMITNRPYRTNTKTSSEAIAELRRCSGTQFDPMVVEIFINLISQQNQK